MREVRLCEVASKVFPYISHRRQAGTYAHCSLSQIPNEFEERSAAFGELLGG